VYVLETLGSVNVVNRYGYDNFFACLEGFGSFDVHGEVGVSNGCAHNSGNIGRRISGRFGGGFGGGFGRRIVTAGGINTVNFDFVDERERTAEFNLNLNKSTGNVSSKSSPNNVGCAGAHIEAACEGICAVLGVGNVNRDSFGLGNTGFRTNKGVNLEVVQFVYLAEVDYNVTNLIGSVNVIVIACAVAEAEPIVCVIRKLGECYTVSKVCIVGCRPLAFGDYVTHTVVILTESEVIANGIYGRFRRIGIGRRLGRNIGRRFNFGGYYFGGYYFRRFNFGRNYFGRYYFRGYYFRGFNLGRNYFGGFVAAICIECDSSVRTVTYVRGMSIRIYDFIVVAVYVSLTVVSNVRNVYESIA